jgi:hypothetical protein
MHVFAHFHQSFLYGKLNFLISTDMDSFDEHGERKILLLTMLWIRIRISELPMYFDQDPESTY